jgi:hypothetical protein
MNRLPEKVAIGIWLLLAAPVILILIYAFFIIVGAVAAYWPIIALLPVLIICWVLAKKKKGILWQAARDMLGPILLGAAISFGLTLVAELLTQLLNALDLEKTLKTIELLSLKAYFVINTIKGRLTFGVTISILIMLVLLNRLWPKIKFVKVFSSSSRLITKALIALLVVTSFSFFSDYPLSGEAVRQFGTLRQQYKDLTERTREERAKTLAAHHLLQQIDELDDSSRQYYKELFTQLKNYRAYDQSEVANRLSKLQAAAIETPRKSATSDIDQDVPVTISEKAFSDIQARVDKAEEELDQVKYERSQAKEALETAFAGTLSLAVPEFKGLLGSYLEAIVDKVSEYFIEGLAPKAINFLERRINPTEGSLVTAEKDLQKADETIRNEEMVHKFHEIKRREFEQEHIRESHPIEFVR